MTNYPAHIIAQAREIAGRNGLMGGGGRTNPAFQAALCEALSTTPPSEEAMEPFDQLRAAIKADPEYAWSWHCNLAVPIMDAIGASHKDANRVAALIMAQMFDYDITTHESYEWGKSTQQAYHEARVAAEREEDAEAATYEPAPTPKPEPTVTEDHLRRACEELGGERMRWTLENCRHNPILITVARLLAERDAMQAEIASLRDYITEPTPDPDLVLAEQVADETGNERGSFAWEVAKDTALRTIRALKLKGQAHDQ